MNSLMAVDAQRLRVAIQSTACTDWSWRRWQSSCCFLRGTAWHRPGWMSAVRTCCCLQLLRCPVCTPSDLYTNTADAPIHPPTSHTHTRAVQEVHPADHARQGQRVARLHPANRRVPRDHECRQLAAGRPHLNLPQARPSWLLQHLQHVLWLLPAGLAQQEPSTQAGARLAALAAPIKRQLEPWIW